MYNRRDTLASNECHRERCLIKHSMVFIVTIRALINRDENHNGKSECSSARANSTAYSTSLNKA